MIHSSQTIYTGKAIGMYIDDCHQYAVENNTFHSNYTPGTSFFVTGAAAGIINTNNRNRQNTIYRNQFNNIVVGAQSLGWNKDETRTKVLRGLYYSCNDYQDNANDNFILDDLDNPQPNPLRVGLPQQGSLSQPAANLFGTGYATLQGTPAISLHIKNTSLNQFDYWHHDPFAQPRVLPAVHNMVPQGNVLINAVQNNDTKLNQDPNECQSTISTSWDKTADKNECDLLLAQKQLLEDEISLNQDGGNTTGLMQTITQTTSANVSNTISNLLGASPHLSTDVLELLAGQQSPFLHSQIQTVLLANPHSGRTPEVLVALQSRPDGYPTAYFTELDSAAQLFTARDSLHQNFYNHTVKYTGLISKILQNGLSEDADCFAEIIEPLLLASDVLHYKYTLIDLYDQRGDVQSATNLLNSLPSVFVLNPREQDYHQDFTDLRNLLHSCQNSGKNILTLDSSDITSLLSYRLKTSGITTRVLMPLVANGAVEYNPKFYVLDDQMTQPLLQEMQNQIKANTTPPIEYLADRIAVNHEQYPKNSLVIHPNPTQHHTTLTYQSTTQGCVIELHNHVGKVVDSFALRNTTGTISLDTKYLRNGVYYVWLRNAEGHITAKTKLLIVR